MAIKGKSKAGTEASRESSKMKTKPSTLLASSPSTTTPKAKSYPKSKSTHTLYSSFNPIPITIPSQIPIPSPSKKTLSSTTHYIYVRPHKPTSTGGGTDDGRTVFVTNLPVDIGQRELRSIFGTWGVVEDITLGRSEAGDTLEKAVKGSLEEEDSGDDNDDDEEGEEDEQDEAVKKSDPQFVPNEAVVLSRGQKKRQRRKKGLPPSVPSIIPLPGLNPRTDIYGPSGSHIAHITYVDSVSIKKVMSYSGASIPLPTPKSSTPSENPTGLEYYTSLHTALRPRSAEIKSFADSSMNRYDHLHSLLLSSRAKQKGAGALVDEDGFTVVVRGGRYGRTGGRGDLGSGSVGVGVAKRGLTPKELKGGAAEMNDFYKFQKVDKKRKGTFIISFRVTPFFSFLGRVAC
jgi:ribosomal RNA-processing protein 7